MKKNQHKAFTLIELMVVIAIIGLLSSTVLTSLNVARAKARDAIRQSTLIEVQKALELYYSAHGFYPQFDAFSVWDRYGINGGVGWGNPQLYALVTEGYLSSLPDDPINTETLPSNFLGDGPLLDMGYRYEGFGGGYLLGTNLETKPQGGDCGNWGMIGGAWPNGIACLQVDG